MGRKASRRPGTARRRIISLATGIATLLFYAILVAGPAQAAVTCTFSSGTLTVTTSAGEDPAVSRAAGSAGAISVTGCGAISGSPTAGPTGNTTLIHLDSSGDAGNNTYTIDLTNGWGTINWTVSGGGGTDGLIIAGTSGPDTVKVGGAG